MTDFYKTAKLSDPISIGPLKLTNRWAAAPMVTSFPIDDIYPTPLHIAFYRQLARGGAGLVTIGATAVSISSRGFQSQMCLDRDNHIPHFSKLANEISKFAPSIIQIFHAGPKTSSRIKGAIAVGPVASKAAKPRYDNPEILSENDLQKIIQDFCDAIQRAATAGFAGALIHGGNGYLVHCITDTQTNTRDDKWGRPYYFLDEMLHCIRKNVPSGFPIGYTISPANSLGQISNRSIDEFLQLAHWLSGRGISFLHIYRNKELITNDSVISFASLLRKAGIFLPLMEGAGIRSINNGKWYLSNGADIVPTGRTLLLNSEFPSRDLPISAKNYDELASSTGIARWFERFTKYEQT